MTNRERRIREIAYHLWEKEGRPEGEDHSHRLWLAAEAQFEAEIAERKDAGNERPAEPAVEMPVRRAQRKTDGAPAEKPARSAKTAEAASEKKAASPRAKTAEPAAEKPAGPGKRKPGAK
jgi:Protein of unknown function (DUF2934)